METNVHGVLNALGFHLDSGQLEHISLAIFVITYLMIMSEKYFHRTIAALLGASAVMVLGVVTPQQAWDSVNYSTIFLLFGMMNIVTIVNRSGFFALVGERAVVWTGGRPSAVLWVFSLLTAVFSAFLDNVTTVLFMAPVIIHVAQRLKLKPIPYLVGVVLASNAGGTATLIGDPPNILIGTIAGKSFNSFLIHVAPYVVAAFIVGVLVMQLFMALRGELKADVDKNSLASLARDADHIEVDRRLMRRSLVVFVITIVLFMFDERLGLSPGVIALAMSTVLMLITDLGPGWILERVEWTTLIFFMGLFIVVGALQQTGLFDAAARLLGHFIDGDVGHGVLIIGFSSALISGIVDNIPFTLSMANVLKELQAGMGAGMDPLWWVLSLGACLGGNLTLIGASANIVTADIAERNGHKISFFRFMLYGTPVAIVTVLVAILLFYFTY